jgi:hypothetical protein
MCSNQILLHPHTSTMLTTISRCRRQQKQQQQMRRNLSYSLLQIRWISCLLIVVVCCCCSSSVFNNTRKTITTTVFPSIVVQAFHCNDAVSSIRQKSLPSSITRTTTTTTTTIIIPRSKIPSLLERRQQKSFTITRQHTKFTTTQLYFMGSDSGILGVGGPEVVRITSSFFNYVTLYLFRSFIAYPNSNNRH